MPSDNDQVNIQCFGFFSQGFRNAAIHRFKQQGLGVDAGSCLHRFIQQFATGIGNRRDRLVEIQRRRYGAAVHAEQRFVCDVRDVQLGITGSGNVQRFFQCAT